ncbi:hypothetical protein [Spiroplasma endosymbiont of Melieria omissa]
MTYFELKDKPDQYFRKIAGINKLVFNEILNILLDHQNGWVTLYWTLIT